MDELNYPGDRASRPVPSFESAPLTRGEYIQALVHFYRGELYRSTQWRLRLDTTTNWAILSVMALVTFSLGDPTHSHVGIIAGMVLVYTFLSIEARRFRFFDLWRARVRMLEENFYGPLLRRDLESPIAGWGRLVAEDLLHPRFKMTFLQAFRARLVRNYIALFLLLLFSWAIKLAMHPTWTGPGSPFLGSMRIGPIPWWVSAGFVAGLYAYLLLLILLVPRVTSPEIEYWGEEGGQEALSPLDI